MSQRAFLTIGGVVAAGGAYYLYKAGGDPKAAQKRIERESNAIIYTSNIADTQSR